MGGRFSSISILTFLLSLCVAFPHLLVPGALRSLVSVDSAVKGMRKLNHICCLSEAAYSLIQIPWGTCPIRFQVLLE